MAKQIEGVYEAILSCAKKEFLEKGYKDASLRVIAQEAGTSTVPFIPVLEIKKDFLRRSSLPPPSSSRRCF